MIHDTQSVQISQKQEQVLLDVFFNKVLYCDPLMSLLMTYYFL